jgi:hypothetical protein
MFRRSIWELPKEIVKKQRDVILRTVFWTAAEKWKVQRMFDTLTWPFEQSFRDKNIVGHTVLSKDTEGYLIRILMFYSKAGMPMTVQDVREIV